MEHAATSILKVKNCCSWTESVDSAMYVVFRLTAVGTIIIVNSVDESSWQITKFSKLKSKEMCSDMCGELWLWARAQKGAQKTFRASVIALHWKENFRDNQYMHYK